MKKRKEGENVIVVEGRDKNEGEENIR